VCVLTSIAGVAPLKDYFSNPFKQSPLLSFKRNLSFQSQNIWDNPNPSSAENFGINQDWRPNPLCNVCRWGSEVVCITFLPAEHAGQGGPSPAVSKSGSMPWKKLARWQLVFTVETVASPGARTSFSSVLSLPIYTSLSLFLSLNLFPSRTFSNVGPSDRRTDGR